MTLSPIYALYVTNERKAAAELSEAGFEVWAPTYQKRVERGRLSSMVPAALFPGYVFARIADGRFAEAKTCSRVAYVVCCDGAPAPLPELDFANMILLVMSGRMDERGPATKARPRGVRKRGLSGLQAWFDAVGRGMRRAA